MDTIGVDIGGTKIAAGVVDEDGAVLAQAKRDTVAGDPAEIDRAVADLFLELSADFEIGALGIAAAGYMSSDRRTALFGRRSSGTGFSRATTPRNRLTSSSTSGPAAA